MVLTKWIGTVLCLIGIGLTAFNIYPDNIWFSLAGSFLWMTAGFLQRDVPLFLVEGVAVFMYLAGAVKVIL